VYPILTGSGFDPDHSSPSVVSYLETLSEFPKTLVVLIKSADGAYIYIPNDGSFGEAPLIGADPDQTNAGILIPLDWDPAATTTRVTCTSYVGSYGTGCHCTKHTVTVVCQDNEPCYCGGGDQCSGTCNNTDGFEERCSDPSPFYDETPFSSLDPHTFI